MKSNPYLYPYYPFEDLSNKILIDNFGSSKIISNNELPKLVSEMLNLKIEFDKTGSIADVILNFFLDENVRFGPKEFVTDQTEAWKQQINGFVKRNKPIEFTILGFPFKVAVSLKTDRTLPDLGEVLLLTRLFWITQQIKEIYQPGGVINIFTEGVFNEFTGNSKTDSNDYKNRIIEFVNLFGYNQNIKVIDLYELEPLAPGFREEWKNQTRIFKEQYLKRDTETIKKFDGAFPSIFRIVSAKEYPTELLMDVYNEQISDRQIGLRGEEVRKILKDRAKDAVFTYNGYHQARYNVDLIKKFLPESVYFTVSPKICLL